MIRQKKKRATLFKILSILIFMVGFRYASLDFKSNSDSLFHKEKSNVFLHRGLALYNDHHFQAAIDFFLKSIASNSKNQMAKRMLGQALYFAGDIREAENEWLSMVSTGKKYPNIENHLKNLSDQKLKFLEEDNELEFRFLKYILPKNKSRYMFPVYVGQLPDHHIFLLSMDQLNTGSFMRIDMNGEFTETLRRISGKLNMPVGGSFGNNQIWITDFKADSIHRIKWDKNGLIPIFDSLEELGHSGDENLEFRGPAGICYLNKYFYVVDSGNHRVQKISQSGSFSISFPEKENGHFLNSPFGIACHKAGKIYVSGKGQNKISIFDEYGNFISSFGQNFLKKPRHIHLNQKQNYLSIADETGSVFVYDLKSNKVKSINEYRTQEEGNKKFIKPYSIMLDSLDNLYVADYSDHKLIQFSPEKALMNNLEIWLERVDTNSFPVIALWVSIKDHLRNYVSDLNEKNFEIFENNVRIQGVRKDYLQNFTNQMKISILVSRTKKMKEYQEGLKRTLNFIISDLRQKDKIKLIGYRMNYQDETPWTNSRILLKDRIQKINPKKEAAESNSNMYKNLGKNLYYAGQSLLKEKGKRALIWIHEGEIDEYHSGSISMWKTENFLKNNHIPLYIINFESPGILNAKDKKETLMQMARNTRGEYYKAYSSSLKDINKRIRSQKKERHVIYYKTHALKEWKGQYMELKLNVKLHKRVGSEIGGYFVP